MSIATIASSTFVLLLVACGGAVADVSSEPAPSGSGNGAGASGSGSGSETIGPDTIIGRAIALEEVGALTYERFDLELQPEGPLPDPCGGAIATSENCCAFPPIRPPPTMPPGDGSGDGTNVSTESSAGTVTLTDATTHASLGTFEYQSGAYSHAPANWTQEIWKPGDTLVVQAAGASIGPFSVSAPALVVPTVALPSSIDRTRDLAIAWTPDSNADLFTLTLGAGGGRSVVCSATDPKGALTVDASMLATFDAGARIQGVAERSVTKYARTPSGRIAFETFAWQMLDAAIP